jgi:transcriptional regulator with XRE-family HTH domain
MSSSTPTTEVVASHTDEWGQRSRNACARYEQGKTMPTVEKLEQLLEAIAPDQKIVWRIAA